MVKAHFIINPASRDFRCGKAWPGIKKRLIERGFEVVEHMTERIGHGAELSHQFEQKSRQVVKNALVVAVGGDGIVHEVASGLRGSNIPLGQIPFGSGNDCCITHGIPRQSRRCTRHSRGRCGPKLWSLATRRCCSTHTRWLSESTFQRLGWRRKHDGRTVRWVFLESDAGITSAISRAKLRRAKWIKGQRSTPISALQPFRFGHVERSR